MVVVLDGSPDAGAGSSAGLSSSSGSPHLLLLLCLLLLFALLLMRAIKRGLFSPTITATIRCNCGSIEGIVRAKKEDSIMINCYCKDCRQYANYVASLADGDNNTSNETDDSRLCARVVQVCKNAVHVHKGRNLLKLARKSEPGTGMYRFYSGCCCVPMFNTVNYLGFVGIFIDRLIFDGNNNHSMFDGPVCMFPEEREQADQYEKDATQQQPQLPPPDEPKISVPDFLWKLVRYQPYANTGPFDYDQVPLYWGGNKEKKNA